MTLPDIVAAVRKLYQVEPAKKETYLNNGWAIISVVVLSALNHPEDIAQVYRLVERDIENFGLSKDDELALKVQATLKLREGILKGYVAAGFPRTINGLIELRKATSAQVLEKLPQTPIRKEESWDDYMHQRARGQALFDTIYDRHTKRVMQSMADAYPDLAQTALHHLYGPLLSEGAVLTPRETSLIVVTGTFAMCVPSQLRGHIHGALHNGALKVDIERLYETVLLFCRHYGNPLPPLINVKL